MFSQNNQVLMTTCLAMLAFAGNSVLCRVALKETDIDAASFNSIRLISGALILVLICKLQSGKKLLVSPSKNSLLSALSLFVYAAGFAFAYVDMSAATGALLLFGAVQFTMLGYAIYCGERLTKTQIIGLLMALTGVGLLLLPNSSPTPISAALLMALAGVAWGVYSILGKQSTDPTSTAAQSFLFAVPLALLLSLVFITEHNLDPQGVVYAMVSGAITSGMGYALWYAVLPYLKSTVAASAQLSVPAITAIAGALFIGEAITAELLITTAMILTGIGFVTFAGNKTK